MGPRSLPGLSDGKPGLWLLGPKPSHGPAPPTPRHSSPPQTRTHTLRKCSLALPPKPHPEPERPSQRPWGCLHRSPQPRTAPAPARVLLLGLTARQSLPHPRPRTSPTSTSCQASPPLLPWAQLCPHAQFHKQPPPIPQQVTAPRDGASGDEVKRGPVGGPCSIRTQRSLVRGDQGTDTERPEEDKPPAGQRQASLKPTPPAP